ncbi:MAG: 6-carboxytetrahydropterin synthase, partial [Hyphomonadaceae bacterium]|nr:6-carboxytetrahydropterin synthase [Clostridia bacterium]
MLTKQYRFKFYLNAMHSVKINNKNSTVHPHTWEIVLYITKINEDVFVQFTEIEKKIELFLSIYEGQYLNDISPFDLLSPTLENIGDVFARQVINMLRNNAWEMRQLEISENPSRTYIIATEQLRSLTA